MKSVNFREVYEIDNVMAIYYEWDKSRIMTFFMGIKKAFLILVVSFRILMRISPSVD